MSYKITGASPDPENTVSISTTAESPEKAARIAQDWSNRGVRDLVIADIDGRPFDLPALKGLVRLSTDKGAEHAGMAAITDAGRKRLPGCIDPGGG